LSGSALALLLPLPVAFPLCGAILAPLLARRFARLPVVVSMLALAGSAAVLLAAAPDVFGLLFALTVAIVGAVLLLLLHTLSELGGLGRPELGGRQRCPRSRGGWNPVS